MVVSVNSTWIRNQRLLCQFKCWLGVYCRAVDQCAPRATVLRQVAPPLHVLLPAEDRRESGFKEKISRGKIFSWKYEKFLILLRARLWENTGNFLI